MAETVASDIKIIIFQLLDKEYAIPVSQVRSIEKVQHITRVPRTIHYIKGVINLRGLVTPIIDLRERFGLQEVTEYSGSSRIIIVTLDEMDVGLVVDAANDVIDISPNAIEPPPEVVGVLGAEYINGVTKIDKRLLILLDLEKILNIEEVKSFNGMEG